MKKVPRDFTHRTLSSMMKFYTAAMTISVEIKIGFNPPEII